MQALKRKLQQEKARLSMRKSWCILWAEKIGGPACPAYPPVPHVPGTRAFWQKYLVATLEELFGRVLNAVPDMGNISGSASEKLRHA